HEVVRFAETIERYVDVKLELSILRKRMLGNFENAVRLKAVRRQVDVANAVVAHEQVNDLRQILSQCRFTAAEPKVGERRSVRGQLDDLVPGQIAFLIQLVPVKTRLAGCV